VLPWAKVDWPFGPREKDHGLEARATVKPDFIPPPRFAVLPLCRGRAFIGQLALLGFCLWLKWKNEFEG